MTAVTVTVHPMVGRSYDRFTVKTGYAAFRSGSPGRKTWSAT